MKYFFTTLLLLLSFSFQSLSESGVVTNFLRMYPSSLPSLCNQGDLRFDISSLQFEYCDAVNTWHAFAGGGGTTPVSGGGTGQVSFPLNSILLGNTTSPLSYISPGTATYVLTSTGSSVAWSSPSGGTGGGGTASYASSAGNVTGIVAVPNGGTGSSSYPANAVLLGNSTSPISYISPGTNNYVLTSTGSSVVWQAGGGSGGAASNPPTITSYTATGTQTGWVFSITAASATVGATYTNNSNTYTVLGTISSLGGFALWMSGTGATSGSTLTKASGTGDATISFSSKVAIATYTPPANVVYLRVRMVGGGASGGGGGTSGFGAGNAGNSTFFGPVVATAGGGNYASIGGTATIYSPYTGLAILGGSFGNTTVGLTGGTGCAGSLGGDSPMFGGGGKDNGQTTGQAGATNTGGGGQGGGGTGSSVCGAGGGSGAFADVIITGTILSNYYYAIGGTSTGGTAGTSGFAG